MERTPCSSSKSAWAPVLPTNGTRSLRLPSSINVVRNALPNTSTSPIEISLNLAHIYDIQTFLSFRAPPTSIPIRQRQITNSCIIVSLLPLTTSVDGCYIVAKCCTSIGITNTIDTTSAITLYSYQLSLRRVE